MHKKISFFPKNKRGGEKYLSPYWFVIIIGVAFGITAMVYLYYGAPYDVREAEANLLIDRVADCISYAGKINASFISKEKVQFAGNGNDFLRICHLNFSSTEEETQYYVKVNFYNLPNSETSALSIYAGNLNFPAYCEIQEGESQDTLPTCVRSSFYSLDDSKKEYIIEILAVVGKVEKNAKT